MTVSEVELCLRTASEPERLRLLALILREARDPDVRRFVTPEEVVRLWPRLAGRLGLRRGFWELLLDRWKRLGLVEAQTCLASAGLRRRLSSGFSARRPRSF